MLVCKYIGMTVVSLSFYFFQGGMKAVIWTDVFMFVVIEATIILVLTMGSIEAGGISRVWQINKDAGRLDVLRFFYFFLYFNAVLHYKACTRASSAIELYPPPPSILNYLHAGKLCH